MILRGLVRCAGDVFEKTPYGVGQLLNIQSSPVVRELSNLIGETAPQGGRCDALFRQGIEGLDAEKSGWIFESLILLGTLPALSWRDEKLAQISLGLHGALSNCRTKGHVAVLIGAAQLALAYSGRLPEASELADDFESHVILKRSVDCGTSPFFHAPLSKHLRADDPVSYDVVRLLDRAMTSFGRTLPERRFPAVDHPGGA